MPVYEYRCRDCSRECEYQQRMADAAKTVCEACGGTLERMISRSAFHLKGGGWYKDLYSSTKPEAASGSSDESGSGAAASAPATPAANGAGAGAAAPSPAAPSTSPDKPSSSPATPAPAAATPAKGS